MPPGLKPPRFIQRARSVRASGPGPAAAVGMGSIGYGAGGPIFLDAFRSKRAPTATELVNSYKAVAFACIRLNACGVARVPLRLYATTGKGERRPRRSVRRVSIPEQRRLRKYKYLRRSIADDVEIDEVTEHPFLDALDAPNPYFDGNLFLQHAVVSLDVTGTSYFFPVRPDVSFASREWWPLHSQYVFPIKGENGEVLKHYQYFAERFAPDELVRFRTVSIRDPYLSGFAPLHACFEQLGLVDYYTAVVESILKTGARMSVVFTPTDPDKPPGEPERQRFERDVNNRFTGGRSGHALVTNGAWTPTPIQFPPEDLAKLEISKHARLIAANCFDVPISMLDTESSNRATAEASIFQHQYYAIEPRCVLLASALTHQLARPVDPRLFFAFDNPVGANKELDAKVFDIYLKDAVLSPDEVRAEIDYDAAAWGGEEPYISNTLVQPSTADAQRELTQSNLEKGIGQKPPATGKEDEPDPGETPDKKKPKPDDDERALMESVSRLLDRLGEQLETRATPGHRDGDACPRTSYEPAADPGSGRAAGEGRAREHVWTADGGATPAQASGVVQQAAQAGPGDNPDGGDRAAGDDRALGSERHGRMEGPDDADDRGVLGRVGEGDAGETGPGPGRVAGEQPVHGEQDPGGDPPVLPGNEPDDQPPAQ